MRQFFLWVLLILAAIAGAVLGAIATRRVMKPKIVTAEDEARAARDDARVARDDSAARRREAEHERERHRRQLATASDEHLTACDAYRLSETRFEVARLAGKLREFICVLGQEPGFDRLHGDTTRLLASFDAARSQIENQDPTLASVLATSRGELEFVLYPERGSSASTADEGIDTVAALRMNARRTAAKLDRWIDDHQPSAPID
jgi:hypothetical protein